MLPTITLAMIVRNEAANLPACLESVKDAVDEIVVVDTGSTDQTREIAAKYTDKIYHYTWGGDFGAARNFAIEKSSGMWILSLDADEFLDNSHGSLGECIINNDFADVIFLPLYYLHAEHNTLTYDRFLVLRLFRNLPQYRFAGAIHEQLIVPCPGAERIANYPIIWHKALSVKDRNKKRNRNVSLLKKAYANDPDNLYLKYYLGLEWLGFGKVADALPLFAAVCAGVPADHILFRAPAVSHYVLCLRLEGRLEEALAVCIAELKQYPEYTDLFFDAGLILEEQGKYQQAVSWFNTAVAKGSPPPEFVHTHGVESYLAFYHLGYCYEAGRNVNKAEYYYQQAYYANNEYADCLLNLFHLKLSSVNPSEVYQYFRELGCYRRRAQTQLLVNLFLLAGLPEWAAACYDEYSDADILPGRIKTMILSGAFLKAGVMLNNARQNQFPLFWEDELYEIIAALLAEEYTHCHMLALTMWRTPAKRSAALAVLQLLSQYTAAFGAVRPEKHREPEITRILLALLDGCLMYREKRDGAVSIYSGKYGELAEKIMQTLMDMSASGCDSLLAYLAHKSKSIYTLLTTRLRTDAARGLYDE